ncbi:polysaccharide pyruvyl transferase family protein [Mesorhizobium sp. RMAD-H1]|uniref:polysaccharide pyruvyl transferase family protein n=1 Tax=Mesorhizobium sp. RMAD-H1 TaxID=2587065 RepID=UPI001611A1E1|nr:polysaccharide pyruvyl transferase family protein [Mesorhizobium sp. RMAD-H1]MBB2971359.1 succinoglycan biosynthesis protein ExoV [Mesorhizobium sp. RMAD-H1]
MRPFHWQSNHGNFGDDLNLWLWDFLLPGFRDGNDDVLLVGAGTVLNATLLPKNIRKLVIGSGYGYGTVPQISDRSEWDIHAVRGPRTAAKLGLDARLGIIDPAVMVTDMPEFRSLPKKHKTIFVPHWESAIGGIWDSVCKTVGLTYIDPCGEAKSVIRDIAQSRLVIAESMHAAILADAFRIPWIAVTTSGNINSFKWNDWADSVGTTYKPHRVPVSTRAEAIFKGERFWGINYENRSHPVTNVFETRYAPDGTVLTAGRKPLDFSPRNIAKQLLAAPSALALWQASRAEPNLSPDGRVSACKERFLEALEGVRRQYF